MNKLPSVFEQLLADDLLEEIYSYLIPLQFIFQIKELRNKHNFVSNISSNNKVWLKSDFYKYALMKNVTKSNSYEIYIQKKWMSIYKRMKKYI